MKDINDYMCVCVCVCVSIYIYTYMYLYIYKAIKLVKESFMRVMQNQTIINTQTNYQTLRTISESLLHLPCLQNSL